MFIRLLKDYIKFILNAKSIESYLKWYIKSEIWHDTKWRGINSAKFPCDMWNYQEIITERNVTTVIECGSRFGGSGLFFADLLKSLGREKSIVFEIDIEDQWQKDSEHELITRLLSSSTSNQSIQKMEEIISNTTGTVLVILDSSHKKDHVLMELKKITPLLRTDDYLVIEDTTLIKETMSAVVEYMKKNPNQYLHDLKREQRFGVTLAKYGYWVKS